MFGYIQTLPQTVPVAVTPSFSSINVAPAAAARVKCTEFEPECDLVDTTVTVFAATELSTVHAGPNVVPLSKPSQNTAAAGQPALPSPDDAPPAALPLAALPPSPLPPASFTDIIIVPPLEPPDPPSMTPLPFPPDELLLMPPLRLLPLPVPALPPLLEEKPASVIVIKPTLDDPPCTTEPASGPGDDAALLHATNAEQAKPREIFWPERRAQGKLMVICSPQSGRTLSQTERLMTRLQHRHPLDLSDRLDGDSNAATHSGGDAELLASLTIAREWERGSMAQLFATPVSRPEILVGKLIHYAGLGFVQTLLVITLGSYMFDVPIRGSLVTLFVSSTLFLLAMLGTGLTASIIAKSQLVAVEFATLVSYMPVARLSGFMFPIENMPWWLRGISMAVPGATNSRRCVGCCSKGNGLDVLARLNGAQARFPRPSPHVRHLARHPR